EGNAPDGGKTGRNLFIQYLQPCDLAGRILGVDRGVLGIYLAKRRRDGFRYMDCVLRIEPEVGVIPGICTRRAVRAGMIVAVTGGMIVIVPCAARSSFEQ